MRLLVLGGGLQGSACAYDLLCHDDVEAVRLADVRADRLPPFLEPFAKDARLERIIVDARDERAVRTAMHGVDACANALPYWFNEPVARLAIESGVHCCDLGGNTEIVFRQLAADVQAGAAGVSVVPDCGLAPGMANILAAAGIRAMDQAESAHAFVGGLPQHPAPPLNYQIVYSLAGVLDYYTTPTWVIRDGRRTRIEALSEIETIEFDEPVGRLEAFHTAGGLSTQPWTFEGRIRTMEYKTLRYPGHAEIMRAVRGLGLLGLDAIDVRGQPIVPRDVFIACAEPRLRRPGGRDLVALRVEVNGRIDGRAATRRYELLDWFDEETGISAMERCTGFSLAITARLQAAGRIASGVATPDRAVPVDAYIEGLRGRGVRIRQTGG